MVKVCREYNPGNETVMIRTAGCGEFCVKATEWVYSNLQSCWNCIVSPIFWAHLFPFYSNSWKINYQGMLSIRKPNAILAGAAGADHHWRTEAPSDHPNASHECWSANSAHPSKTSHQQPVRGDYTWRGAVLPVVQGSSDCFPCCAVPCCTSW